MKNKLVASLFIISGALTLCSCSSSSKGSGSGIYVPNIDNSKDLEKYSEEEYVTEEEETYYQSDYISFVMSVKGYYQINIPFILDKDNENLRIYDNMYFYEKDYFHLISKDYKYIWATLKNENTEYLTPLREEGEDIQVDVKKSGVYKITLDITTMIMDFEYKSEIVTPYYYPFKDCVIGHLVDEHIVFSDMTPNQLNNDEFVITDYEVETGKLYSFYSNSHISNYKLTVAENSKSFVSNTMFDTSVAFNISGKVNIYVNRKTYEIRAEVSDPSSLVYDCVTYINGGFVTLTPKEASTPYIFECEYEATSDVGGYGVMSDDLPKFYNKSYKEYELSVEESNLLGKTNKGAYYFKKKGHYLITVDLLNLTLRVEAVGE